MSHPVILRNGDVVKVNGNTLSLHHLRIPTKCSPIFQDHVYCSPSWDSRDGTPYSVARIMQFLPPEDAPKGEDGKNYLYTRVRLAWYYRPSDVSDRPVADPRLLLAAIYSEVCDINQLRAKCHVVHRDRISDLSGWKKRPDRFYFNRLFDPYIKKEFEVIPSHDVRNLPDHIRDVLIERYEYVVAEKEVIPDLTDTIRLCDTCRTWCPTFSSSDSVLCDRCKKYFHMKCVQPPLLAKPSRGYGWTCAPCSKRHEEEVDSHEHRHATPAAAPKLKSNAPAARGRGRPRKDKSLAEKEESLPVKHFNMWPFRYFGQHTVAEDTLANGSSADIHFQDPEDLIFPRTASRVGPKYQASIPPELPYNPPSGKLAAVPSSHLVNTCLSELEERGTDNTVEVMGIFNTFTESESEEVKERLSNDPKVKSSVDWLTEVVRRLSEAAMDGSMSSVKVTPTRMDKFRKIEIPWTDKEWNREEVVAFEDAISQHGAELRAVRDEVATRSMPEVVRFYGHWKNMKLGEENRRRKTHGPPPKPPAPRYWLSEEEAHDGQRVGSKDDESSIIAQPSKTPSCAACRTRESKTWWKAPKGLPTNILCDTCGTNWRKYADLNVRPLREESVPLTKTREKREGTPLAGPSTKRARTSTSVQSTPPPTISILPQNRCLACMKHGPLGKVLKCKQCQFRVHAGIESADAIGSIGAVVDPANVDSWMCELCENEETLEASVNPDCLLCPRSSSEDKKKKPWPPADTFLRACKPTEGQGWAHVLCSVFTPELSFTDASRLRLVEGLNTVGRHRWSTRCCLCGETEGAVIRCSDCSKEFHASCAWKQGHKFGFEIQPVKSSRRDSTITVNFKGESGCMNAIVSCKDHDHSKRDIYDICETNEGGETALQVYCQAYKQAAVSQAHGLLRKARRLDSILNLRSEPQPPPLPIPSNPDPECCRCHSQFSPAFYRLSDSSVINGTHSPRDGQELYMCHRCHFELNESSKSMGMMVS
ncbi:hypothetical protein CVT26_003043 [Gymnopilus dilepis]|uniref:Uncharacterized protein n=1 Tax=Gymnopilus dilepis TaxID=231916 RepID=A0A409Y502_9AGAR|nr:hypothetical protein CVT26_003043 [Gymnopilus dilepis]